MSWRRFYSGTRADPKSGDRFYHGTRADLTPGELIKPGHPANFGKLDRVTTYVYFSATLDAGIWGAACGASALLASILAAPVAAQLPKSSFVPVSIASCLNADSLLGPLTEQGAIVRGYYVPKIDSTRLVAGPERGSSIYAGESRPMISVSTSYSGHKPTTYPHADVSFLLIRADASRAASSGAIAEVVLTIDGSPAQLDSVPIKPTPSPVGRQVFISLAVSPNLFVALANAKKAEFVIAKERVAFSPHELRDIRGLYRVALCGVSTN